MNSKPESIKAKLIKDETDDEGNKSTWNIYCNFRDGTKSKSTISNISTRKRRIGMIGDEGMLVLDEMKKNSLQFFKGWQNDFFPMKDGIFIDSSNENEPLYEALMNFFKYIFDKNFQHWSLELGVEVTDLLSKCETEKINL